MLALLIRIYSNLFRCIHLEFFSIFKWRLIHLCWIWIAVNENARKKNKKKYSISLISYNARNENASGYFICQHIFKWNSSFFWDCICITNNAYDMVHMGFYNIFIALIESIYIIFELLNWFLTLNCPMIGISIRNF